MAKMTLEDCIHYTSPYSSLAYFLLIFIFYLSNFQRESQHCCKASETKTFTFSLPLRAGLFNNSKFTYSVSLLAKIMTGALHKASMHYLG